MTGDSRDESAGIVLLRRREGREEALLIRVRSVGYELPKGHLEEGETAADAALRELCEETGLLFAPVLLGALPEIAYSFEHRGRTVRKRVRFFACAEDPQNPIQFGPLPSGTRELRWITSDELPSASLVGESIRPVLAAAFAQYKLEAETPLGVEPDPG